MLPSLTTHIIGVSGGSCSGKTHFVRSLIEEVGPSKISSIEHDSYYRDVSGTPHTQRRSINYDHPSALDTELLTSHLHSLLRGHTVNVPIYDYTTHSRKDLTVSVKPTPFIVVEGILIYHHPELRNIFNLRVYIHAPAYVRLGRRLKRDVNERGRTYFSVLRQYLSTVHRAHNRFVRPTRDFADIQISGLHNYSSSIQHIKSILISPHSTTHQ